MTLGEIKNDYKFRQRCSKCGLNYDDAILYNDYIIVKSPAKKLYVLFDK